MRDTDDMNTDTTNAIIGTEIRERSYAPGRYGAYATVTIDGVKFSTTLDCPHNHHDIEAAAKCESHVHGLMCKLRKLDRVIIRNDDDGVLVEMREYISPDPDTGRQRFNSTRFWEINPAATESNLY